MSAVPGPVADVLPVLAYHDVANGGAGPRFARFVVAPSLFDEHLDALASAGYRSVKAADLATGGAQAESGPAVLLTFDDGFESFATSATPIMQSHGMTGTVFVPSAYVGGAACWLASLGEDRRRVMSAEDLRSLLKAGMEVGSHGDTHRPLDLLASSTAEGELKRARVRLEETLNSPVVTIAYPFGWHTRSIREAAARAGYRVGFEVGDNLHRGAPKVGTDAIMRIQRLVIDSSTTAEELLRLVTEGRRSRAAQRARCMARPGWRVVRRLSPAAGGL